MALVLFLLLMLPLTIVKLPSVGQMILGSVWVGLALAERGMDVVLVARSMEKLEALAVELARKYSIRADAISIDLSDPSGADRLFHETEARGIHVTMLINNAGFATYGPFETLDPVRERAQIMVNVCALTGLARLYLPGLLKNPGSAMVNVASTAAFQPLPYMAVYGATKAFVLSFSEALWAQLQGTNVSVLALCPGPVKTGFAEIVGAAEAVVGKQDSPEFVVHKALRALENGNSFIIPRLSQYLLSFLSRLLPRHMVASISGRVLRPRTVTT